MKEGNIHLDVFFVRLVFYHFGFFQHAKEDGWCGVRSKACLIFFCFQGCLEKTLYGDKTEEFESLLRDIMLPPNVENSEKSCF